ncbi:Gti1/Pac2 family-domain-containing protein [Epithele typhae]|uniref:Gti1/Pac2 family-domain-containing protein n=1 Tax=Epithele typhae TaxID=378194 RepID=UPI0020079507|nr:Gti1/Pac2 family-domain-containing protein [Epithele typhae]KAH9938804.1 Gti1/Pac2 family-domain-containing protein [Epithele typhae]
MSSHDPQSNNTQWTEPPWSGWIETTGDALLILEAARRGLIPRVTRRLVDSERKMITSGSVFVFDEDESGIKRWTDGFFWSPSRILGNFLLYRETEKRGAGHRSARAEAAANTDDPDVPKSEGQTLSRPKSEAARLGIDRQRERILVGSLTNSYKFKQGGMMKKTFSLTIGGVAQHLISYYKIEDVEQGRLRSPSSLPELASLTISPEYLDKTHFRNPPKVEVGVDGIPRYRGEADDVELSPRLLPAPLSSGYYDGSGSSSKRQKRFDPYAPSTVGKRTRKKNNSAGSISEATGGESPTQPLSAPAHGPTTYPDNGLPYPYGYYVNPPTYPPPHAYSPGHYQPPLPAPGTTTPPQDSPSPPASAPAASSSYPYSSDTASGSSTQAAYPAYYSTPAPPAPPASGYPSYQPVHWPPPYTGYSQSAGAAPSGNTTIQDITESDVRNSGGAGGGA